MQKQYLKKMAQDLNCQNVIFIDPVAKEEIFKYILASDLGTSILKKVDTFKTIYSNKTFDYMSCKIPILLLIDGISRDLIEEAKCGFYAEPENINQIVNTIENLAIMSREDLVNFGLNGYNYAIENFDRIKLSKKYLYEINNVINE